MAKPFRRKWCGALRIYQHAVPRRLPHWLDRIRSKEQNRRAVLATTKLLITRLVADVPESPRG